MMMRVIQKIARFGSSPKRTACWEQRSQAFRTWRLLSDARNAARLLPDFERYCRLRGLSEIAWQRYLRRLEFPLQGVTHQEAA